MKILIVNDDGWDAPGLAALAQLAQEFGDVWSVAPAEKMSGCGHQLTLHQPIAVREVGQNQWAVDGTPADCVRLAVARLGVSFDWVWSGINEGSNLGCDVYRSGTVAAAREAALLGISAVAISQYQRTWRDPFDWSTSIAAARRVWQVLAPRELPQGALWNINLPDPSETHALEPGIVDCQVDPCPLPMEYTHDGLVSRYTGRYANRPRLPGYDIDHCFNGAITVSRL